MRGEFRKSRREEVRLKPGRKPLPPGVRGVKSLAKRALIADAAERLVAAGTWPSPAAINAADPSISQGIVGHHRDVLDPARRRWVERNGPHAQWRDPKAVVDAATRSEPDDGRRGVGSAGETEDAPGPNLCSITEGKSAGTAGRDAAHLPTADTGAAGRRSPPANVAAGSASTGPNLDALRVVRLQEENRQLKAKLAAKDQVIAAKDELIRRLLIKSRGGTRGQAPDEGETAEAA